MIKLIAVDIDGTLLAKRRKVSKANIRALNLAREQGIKIVIATGRNIKRAIPIAKLIGLDLHQEYVVCLNGGATYKFDEKGEAQLLEETLFSIEDVKYIYNSAQDCKINCFSYSENPAESYVIKKSGFFVYLMKKLSNRVPKVYIRDTMDQRAYKVIAYGKEDKINNLKETLKEKKYEIYSWSYRLKKSVNIEISPVNIDKKHALQKILRYYNLKSEEVMYFGDGQNDLRSIQWAGHGVAMGNAADEIKQEANHITLHHKKSGVAYKIHELILKNQIKVE